MAITLKEIQNWKDEFLLCRTYLHHMKPLRKKKIQGGFLTSLQCQRCGTKKRLIVDNRGRVVAAHYFYPNGYQRHGKGPLDADDRGQLRLAVLQLVDEGADED